MPKGFRHDKGITSKYGSIMISPMTQRKVSTKELGILRVREDRDELIDHCKDR